MYLRLLLLLLITGLQNAEAIDIFVGNTADSGNGTLRQAIQFNESLGGGNTIRFSNNVTGTITLVNPLGELLISKDVTIIGPGANTLAISGNNAHRVFHLTNNATVNILSLTVTGGYLSPASPDGAGILQDSGTLALSNCIVSSCMIGPALGAGGGICVRGTTLANRCAFFGNYGGSGGGIFVDGIFAAINCTIAGNSDVLLGGGIYQNSGNLSLTNCTLSGNSILTGGGFGGGIYKLGGTATIRNTIIAGNTATGGTSPDCFGAFISAGFNFIGAINGSTGWGALGDQVGTTNSYLNPLLKPLLDNGGQTMTMALQPNSPAIDQGNSSGSLTDQRGRPRPYTNDSIFSIPLGGDRSDIGAYELGRATLVVSNLNDSGSGSFRQTIASASPEEFDFITFGSNLTGTIALTTGELLIGKPLVIQGPTTVPISVSGNNASRVIHITNNSTVFIAGLTIANGNAAAQGAGIYNEFYCNLYLDNCTISSNVSSGNNGGGLANNGLVLSRNCTFTGNRAAFTGGAIYTYAGDVYLFHCTVVSNSTVSDHGGGICSYSLYPGTAAYLENTLVAGNSAVGHADLIGVFDSGGHNLIGKIDYTTPGFGAVAGVPTSGLTDGINYDLVGSVGSPIDPKIGRLQNNGGPTPTMALLSNSPAIDKGIFNNLDLFIDQRGAPRSFDFASIDNANGGDGTDIGAFELGSPLLSISQAGNNAVLSWPFYYGDFSLQSVTNLPSTNWIAVPGTPVVSGNQNVLTNSPITGNKFYRLKSL